MKLLGGLAAIAIAGIGGYTGQAYALPKVGLTALPPGQYAVFFLITVVTVFLAHICRALAGLSGD